jgi:hypothetical protein
LLGQWTASDADGDALTYDVQFSSDGGQTWKTLALGWPNLTFPLDPADLPAGTNMFLKVVASDGINRSSAQSTNAFTVANHVPFVTIVTPATNASFIGSVPIVFEALAGDQDDGLLPGTNVTWTSSLDGWLGQGLVLGGNGAKLSAGKHWITVTAIDSAGATNSAAVPITISRYTAPIIENAKPFSEHTIQFLGVGDADAQHVLEVSTNLNDWVSHSTNAPANGLFEFYYDPAPGKPREFFRVRSQP